MKHDVVSRKTALDNGFRRYFTGNPCARGHLAPRYTVTCACVECVKGYHKKSLGKVRDRELMASMNFRKAEISTHASATPLIDEIIEFINDCQLHPDGTDYLNLLAISLDSLRKVREFERVVARGGTL